MPEAPTVSIIIVSWNTRDALKRCLQSVYAHVPPISFEVIVVDNASEDGSPEMVAKKFPKAKLIRSKTNLGFAGGNNLGLRESHGRFVMLLNSDAQLTPGSVARMIEFMDAHPEVGLIGPKLLSPDGTLQINGQRFPTFVREVLGVLRVSKLVPSLAKLGWGRDDFDRNAEVDSLAGACMLARKEAVDSVGLLDERFFMYFEDVDWCRRIKKAGWKVWYIGEVSIVHGWAQSAKKQGIMRSHYMLHRSRCLYFRKHHGLVQAALIRMVSGMVNVAFAFRYRHHASGGLS